MRLKCTFKSTMLGFFLLLYYFYCIYVADVRKCIISILSYPDGCQDVGYGDDRGSTMPDI